MKFISPRTDIPLLLSYFMVAGCQAPLELDTHQIKSTTSVLIFEEYEEGTDRPRCDYCSLKKAS